MEGLSCSMNMNGSHDKLGLGLSTAAASCKKGVVVMNCRRHRPMLVQCSSTASEDTGEVDRRQLLLSLAAAGVAGLPAATTFSNSAAFAAPSQPPDLKQCNSQAINGVDCCLPVSATITDFKLPTNPALRLRRTAHNTPKEYTALYGKAYQLLRQLPASDPRQFAQQANVHCAFCDSAYVENGTTIEYQVHNSWLFFPWHRWFLYFHERILASVLKDPSFALPFWNWDSASGNTLPPMYAPLSSPLYNANRNPLHTSPAVVDLNYNLAESGLSAAAQLATNNALMYRQFVSASKTPSLFFGQPYRHGDAANPGAGTIENVPHGTVHVWTGNPANTNDEDMGALYSAARDPIFFAHHANLDRLWEVWKSLGGRRKDITDPDWLNATFLFYDENAKLVRVRIGDALDTTKLGYKYEDVPNAWVKVKPMKSKRKKSSGKAVASTDTDGLFPTQTNSATTTKTSSNKSTAKYFKEAAYLNAPTSTFYNGLIPTEINSAKSAVKNIKAPAHPDIPANTSMATTSSLTHHSSSAAMAATSGSTHSDNHSQAHRDSLKEFKDRESKHVERAVSMVVKRPKKVRADEYEEEILVFEGVRVPANEKVKFDVYINLTEEELEEAEAEEGRGRCDMAEYAGSFFNVPHMGKKEDVEGKVRQSNFKMGIGEVLKELGLEEEDSFIVTIIPRSLSTSFPISIHDVILEYE